MMAKKIPFDKQAMLDDFRVRDAGTVRKLDETDQGRETASEKAIPGKDGKTGRPGKRTHRRKGEVRHVSAYLSPAQYAMLDRLARENHETLTRTIGRAIEELWEKRE